jgi:hypothetical protein
MNLAAWVVQGVLAAMICVPDKDTFERVRSINSTI